MKQVFSLLSTICWGIYPFILAQSLSSCKIQEEDAYGQAREYQTLSTGFSYELVHTPQRYPRKEVVITYTALDMETLEPLAGIIYIYLCNDSLPRFRAPSLLTCNCGGNVYFSRDLF